MAQPDELIRDIQQEIEKEKWLAFWHTYRTPLVIAGIAIVLAAGMLGYYLNHAAVLKEESSRTLLENLHLVDLANQEQDPDATIWQEMESLLAHKLAEQQPIAQIHYILTLAYHHLENGRPTEALTVLEASQTLAAPYFEHLFTLWQSKAYTLQGETEKAQALLQELVDSRILQQDNNPSIWGYIALEWLVEIALEQENTALAQEHLKTLSDDPLTPQAMRERATLMLNILS